MRIIKQIIISFSLYSRIPMPIFEWDGDDMHHAITFLPLIGLVIGGVSLGVYKLCALANIPELVRVLTLSLVPLVITGGFHMDGFMDVSDALHSYQSQEKKLEIMKDPHIGAFSVISLLIYGMIWVAALYTVIYKAISAGDTKLISIYVLFFFVARAICGLTSICFEKAKKDGMLQTEAGQSSFRDKMLLVIQTIIGSLGIMYFRPILGVLVIIGLFIYTLIYKYMCDKEFGGVTGDTAGFFVAVSEEVMLVILAIGSILL